MTEFYKSSIVCNTTDRLYSDSHPKVNLLESFIFVTLVTPTSANLTQILGVTSRSLTGFQVALTNIPPTTGYEIYWEVNLPGTDIAEFINDQRYYSKEEIGHPKLSRVHWRNVINTPDLSPAGLASGHNHDYRYYTKPEILAIIDTQIANEGSYTPVADTLMLRNGEGRCQVNTPKVNLDCTNKGYVDVKVSNLQTQLNLEIATRTVNDLSQQAQITDISGSYTPLSTTNLIQVQLNQLQSLVDSISGGELFGGGDSPVGTVISFAISGSPGIEYRYCDGSSYAVTAEQDLFDVIGYTFGGSGSNFNVPDLRGEFIRGWDAGRGVDSGRAIGSNQSGSNEPHTHGATSSSEGGHSHTGTAATSTSTISGTSAAFANNGTELAATTPLTINSAGIHSHTISISSQGLEARPRNVALAYWIKAFNPPIVIPVDVSTNQSISGQKTFIQGIVVPEIPQAIIFGAPSATGTYAIGVIGNQLVVTIHTSAGPWSLVNVLS